MLYAYIKKTNHHSIVNRLPSPREYKSRLTRRTLTIISAAFFLSGLFLVGQVAYPIVGWYLFVLPGYSSEITSPLATSFAPSRNVVYPTAAQAAETSASPLDDSYNVATWFATGTKVSSPTTNKLQVYTLTIPKLKIESATVEIGGDDLKKSLIAWPTSSPPGTYGNNVVFGHSELPQFASPSDYRGIFTHLMDLTKGDEIFIDYDGIRYRYEVFDKSVVSPTNLSVLEQRFDSVYLTLITCVPPGTVDMRGIIKGKLSQI